MSWFAVTPFARRVMLALAVFTLASWAMLLGVLAAWPAAPGRAATVIARLARAASAPLDAPAPAPDVACVDGQSGGTRSYEYGFETGDEEFSWALLDEDGNSTGENMSSRRVRSGTRDDEARFWFIDRGDEFVVRDRALIEAVRAPTRELRGLGSQMDAERAHHDRGHEALSRRMSELSARHHDALRAARVKVREIAGRARREGKAKRPHANA